MEAKEKALILVNKYSNKARECNEGTEWDYDIQCALIDIDNTIEALRINDWQNRLVIYFYEEIKEEINKL
tara:strand:+ start:298 stop:507 length:210 start_codon:yes stop_codon:yes gene_type:complete